MEKDKKFKRSIANVQAYQDVFSSGAGQKVLWDLMKNNGMLSDNFCIGDSHATSYNEGRRSVVLYILKRINENTKTLEKRYEEGLKNEQTIQGLEPDFT